ncbi:MAG: hypothetical protein ACTS44_01745 [Candidatus Hodgkinia cicadicola]
MFKCKVICAAKVLQLRSETSFGPFNEVLAKVATDLLDQVLRDLAIFNHFAIVALRANATRRPRFR